MLNQIIISFCIILSILFSGCATSSKNFKAKDVASNEGVIVGNIKIIINGEDFTTHCYVGFNEDKKPYINLDETGNVIGKTKKGKTTLSYMVCTDSGFITVNHSCKWNGAEFLNVGNGKQSYFGNIKINWSPSGTGAKKVLTLLTGGLGAGATTGMNSCGTQEITISNQPEQIKKAYQVIDPDHINFETRLISKPKSESEKKEK